MIEEKLKAIDDARTAHYVHAQVALEVICRRILAADEAGDWSDWRKRELVEMAHKHYRRSLELELALNETREGLFNDRS